ncbi:MAG: DUF4124 domain-containing protein [Cycloclasticus sp.]|nr:DUF4124 domain-containing protein [Cycloclasticus sp. 44_32_T64]
MYRTLMVCIFLLSSSLTHATIYHWVDEQGTTNYGQTPPKNKSIARQKIVVKSQTVVESQQAQQSIQDSANEISKSNAERKAASDKRQQEVIKQARRQERCETSKENLAQLDYGGNRLYKDAEGNYARFTAEDKNLQREQLNAFINENCR